MAPDSAVIISAEERVARFGVECVSQHGDGVLFKAGTWRPGGEYTQKLTVRNVSSKTKKLRYTLPQTRYFNMAFPVPIELSPGLSLDIDVIFRPVQYESYDDAIHFDVLDNEEAGGFYVRVRARISKIAVHIPDGMDIGLAPTHQITAKQFDLRNTGEVPAPFRWESPAPFQIEPMTGVVPVGEVQRITLSIMPTDASTFVAKAVLHIGEGEVAEIESPVMTLPVSAVGKYPHLCLSENSLDFGEVLIGTPSDASCMRKEVILRNQSDVIAEFSCSRISDFDNIAFSIEPTNGNIPARNEQRITVRLSPRTNGTFSLERFQFQTPSGHKTVLECQAKSVGPEVEITQRDVAQFPNNVDFEDVEVGKSCTRIIRILNHAAQPTRFDVVADPSNVFEFKAVKGEIRAQFEGYLHITFKPIGPINFYRRVFILIENEAPQFLDLYGSGYINAQGEVTEQRPQPLRYAHIQATRNRELQGLGCMSPKELDELASTNESNQLFAPPAPQEVIPLQVARTFDPVTRSGEATRTAVAVAHEMFRRDDDPEREVFLDCTSVMLGYVPASTVNESTYITVTNRSRATVTVAWDISAAGGRNEFTIISQSADILANSETTFTLRFYSRQSNSMFFRELSAFVFFKNQRTFRLVNDATLTAPWHLVVRASAHTCASIGFVPQLKFGLSHSKLHFPACYIGDSTFATVVLHNRSNVLASYNFDEMRNSAFTVHPPLGMIEPEGFALVCVRFRPTEIKHYHQVLQSNVNGEPGASAVLEGVGTLPSVACLELGNNNELFFQPTSVGLATTRRLKIHNTSKLPLRYKLSFGHGVDGVLAVSKEYGLLFGNSVDTVDISFAPQRVDVQSYDLRVKMYAFAGAPPSIKDARQIGVAHAPECLQTITVRCVCPASEPAISFEPSHVDFDVQLVGTAQSKQLYVCNASGSDVQFVIDVVPSSECVECTPVQGTVFARSKRAFSVTFTPREAGLQQFRLCCRMKVVSRDGETTTFNTQEVELMRFGEAKRSADAQNETIHTDLPFSCTVATKSTFPNLIIRDARVVKYDIGSEPSFAWKQLSCSQLNETMRQPLSDEDNQLNMESSPDLSRVPRFAWCFTPRLLGAAPQMFYLQLFNPGLLPTDFLLKFPTDRELEPEPWADEGTPSSEQLMFTSIVDELACFDVQPRAGTIGPRDSLTLSISYNFSSLKFNGIHKLPLLFKVTHGKQVWIDLIGQTLAPSTALLFLPEHTSTELRAVNIGLPVEEVPTQTIRLWNVGDEDAPYNVEIVDSPSALWLVTDEGTATAGNPFELQVAFRPTEARQHTFMLRVTYRVPGGKLQNLSIPLVAEGVDTKFAKPFEFPVVNVNEGRTEPPLPLTTLPSQSLQLSTKRIHFGRLWQGLKKSRVFVIRNVVNEPVQFQIEYRRPLDQTRQLRVQVVPEFGKLQPGGAQVCHVVVESDTLPCMWYDFIYVVSRQIRFRQPPTTAGSAKSRQLGSPRRAATAQFPERPHHTSSAAGSRLTASTMAAPSRPQFGRTTSNATRTPRDKGSSIVSFAQKPAIVEDQAEYGTEQYHPISLVAEVAVRDSQYPNLSHRTTTPTTSPTRGGVGGTDIHLLAAPIPFKHRLAVPSKPATTTTATRQLGQRAAEMQPELRDASHFVLRHLFEALLGSQEIEATWNTLKRTPAALCCSDLQVEKELPALRLWKIVHYPADNTSNKLTASRNALQGTLRRLGLKRKLPRFVEIIDACSNRSQDIDLQQFFVHLPAKLCRSLLRCILAWEEAQHACYSLDAQTAKAIVKAQATYRGWRVRRTQKRSTNPQTEQFDTEDEAAAAAATDAAVLAIQKVMRGAMCRGRKGQLEPRELAAMQQKNMASSDFQFSMQEVFRETMYNLIQECIHDEFDIFSAPVQYLTKLEQP